ncbi:rod shape-determining protein MreD [gut metagenome]|uniref:Rod shape-determining protein MreD n=1 Tax=gut metagenome TaxID=749906 RepID=J9GT39_9ZZZZ
MRRLIWPVLFLFLVVVQGAASVFYTGWLSFDLPLLAIYSYALLKGKLFGAAVGLAVGLVQDAMTTGIFGFHMLTRTVIGYFIGAGKEKIFKDKLSLHAATIGICSAAIRFLYWWIEVIRSGGRWGLFLDFSWASIGYCLGNMLLIVPMFLVVKWLYIWTQKDEITYK